MRLLLVLLLLTRPVWADELVVAGAASLAEVVQEAAQRWSRSSGVRVRAAFDATSRLAAQLEAGAAFDVFISADEAWSRQLERRGLVERDSRRVLATNRLVVIVPAEEQAALDLARVRHLALASENVPAGRYARQALRSTRQWDAVASKVVNGTSVRRALMLVAKGEVDAGIVYATDALVEPAVKVALELPAASHEPVVYPAVVTARSQRKATAQRFIEWLTGPEGRALFAHAGFGAP